MKNKDIPSDALIRSRRHFIDFELPEDGPTHSTFETNPFTGGEIQRKAHAEGKHDYDRSETGRKSWKNRDRKVAAEKMVAGKKIWNENNPEAFLALQRNAGAAGNAAMRLTLEKLEYRGNVYYGWTELEKATGKTKWFLKKDPEVKR